ncbi:unnamed protein product [Chrysoparadoxa australica]
MEEPPKTKDGDMPQKKHYRARAHCNPLSHNTAFDYPPRHEDMDWGKHFPGHEKPGVQFLDIGCGFGGLTVALAAAYPDKCIMGMEIRQKVAEYVRLRIEALRKESPGQYQNTSVLRANTMLYLPQFLPKGMLEKVFICFPDPHFKQKNHRRRVVSTALLTEYAYFMTPGSSYLYLITDVEEVHQWHLEKCDAHPCFERVDDLEAEKDPAVGLIQEVTEEGIKVQRNKGAKYWAVYRRLRDEQVVFSAF